MIICGIRTRKKEAPEQQNNISFFVFKKCSKIVELVKQSTILTFVLGAILYQFAVFMRKKQGNVESSVYVIENEHNKQDLEANGLQPETKL